MSDEVREFWDELEESNAAVSELEALVDCCVGSGGSGDGSGSGDGGDSGDATVGGDGGGDGESRDILMRHNNTVLKDMCKVRKLRVGGNKRKLVDRLLGVEEPRVRQFTHEFGHGVPQVAPLPTDAIIGGSVEKDGGVDEDDEDGRDDDGGSVGMLVEEDEDADEVNCCMGSDMENRGETGDSNMGGVASGGSQLAPCGGCGQPVGGVHRCPGCGAHMHPFCGDPVGEEGYGQMIRCPGCR